MAKKSKTRNTSASRNSLNNYFSQINWGESYTSLFLGAVVVVVALILVFSFVKGKNLTKNTGSSSTTNMSQNGKYPKTYTVKQGEDLWTISEKIYGSGYNWVDIAKANNLTNPDVINAGNVLNVPNVSPRNPTLTNQVANPIRGSTYTVVKGDFLWEIAIRAYGDGYRWVDIAKANNLTNPNFIYSGNVLRLPR